MGNLRLFNLALALLLALSSSGLQMLCAPCVATAAPMACHADMQRGGYNGGQWQAGCCCLVADGDIEQVSFVSTTGPEITSTAQVGRFTVAASPTHPVAPLSRQAHAPKSHPLLFQLHCSFLI